MSEPSIAPGPPILANSRIELRHLRYFLVVAEELHFSRAAERLGLSQPPLSQQIRQLETYLDTALFTRSRRRVELTAAGNVLRPLAQEILRRVDGAIDQVHRVADGEIGELRIGFTRSTALSVELPRAVMQLRQHYPELQLLLQEMNSLQQVEALQDGRLDVGIMRHGALPDALTSIHLLADPLVAVMRADDPQLLEHPLNHPLHLSLLALRDFVMFAHSVGAGIYDHVHALCHRAGFRPRIIQEAGESNTILALIAAGLGVSILPASYQRISSEELRFIPIDDKAARSGIDIVHRRDQRSPMVARFILLLTGTTATTADGPGPAPARNMAYSKLKPESDHFLAANRAEVATELAPAKSRLRARSPRPGPHHPRHTK